MKKNGFVKGLGGISVELVHENPSGSISITSRNSSYLSWIAAKLTSRECGSSSLYRDAASQWQLSLRLTNSILNLWLIRTNGNGAFPVDRAKRVLWRCCVESASLWQDNERWPRGSSLPGGSPVARWRCCISPWESSYVFQDYRLITARLKTPPTWEISSSPSFLRRTL